MPTWKLLGLKRQTLARQYIIYGLGLFVVILATVGWLSYSNYRYFEQSRALYLEKEARKIRRHFDEHITYTEHMLQFIGTKIRKNSNHSELAIAKIIQVHRETFKDDTFTWHMVSYITPEGMLVADSLSGLRQQPIKYEEKKRAWIKEARKDYWKLKFSAPAQGFISEDYIIPSGLGMFDTATNRFLGFLAVGISIDRFTYNLTKVLGDNISFAIFDNKGNLITSSDIKLESENILLRKNLLEKGKEKVYKLEEGIIIGNLFFTHLVSSDKYPFQILVGQNRHYYMQQFKNELVPKVMLYLLFGFIFSMTLIFLGFKAVKPLIELGQGADEISKGKSVQLKKYGALELHLLAEVLNKISITTKDLRIKQGMLSKLNNELQEANEFIKSNVSFLSHELINPLSTIMGFADILQDRVREIRDPELKEISDILHKTANYQYKQLNFFLKLFHFQEAGKKAEFVEIMMKDIIDWNVSMVMHHIKKKGIKVHIEVERGLKMRGDEIMVGQLIQNLAANAAKYNKQGGEIKINAYSKSNRKIRIEFTDSGIGIAQKDIDKIFKRFVRVGRDKNKNRVIGYGLGLAYAQKCADAHGGKITVKSVPGVGSTFTVEMYKE